MATATGFSTVDPLWQQFRRERVAGSRVGLGERLQASRVFLLSGKPGTIAAKPMTERQGSFHRTPSSRVMPCVVEHGNNTVRWRGLPLVRWPWRCSIRWDGFLRVECHTTQRCGTARCAAILCTQQLWRVLGRRIHRRWWRRCQSWCRHRDATTTTITITTAAFVVVAGVGTHHIMSWESRRVTSLSSPCHRCVFHLQTVTRHVGTVRFQAWQGRVFIIRQSHVVQRRWRLLLDRHR